MPVKPVLMRQVVLMLLKLGVGLGNFTLSNPPSGITLQFEKDILITKTIESEKKAQGDSK